MACKELENTVVAHLKICAACRRDAGAVQEEVRYRLFTTGDVARYCDVTTNAVKKWVRNGKLVAHRTPGGHHRISASNFLKFLEENEMPVESEFFARHRKDAGSGTTVSVRSLVEGICLNASANASLPTSKRGE